MIRLLVDTSVLIKWFHQQGEAEVPEALAIRDAHLREDLAAHVIDLAFYEIGNVLTRALSWAADDAADQLDDIQAIVGAPIAMTLDLFRDAAALARRHRLSFYDASWAAAAAGLGGSLVSADRRLQKAGLAESPAGLVRRLSLPIPDLGD